MRSKKSKKCPTLRLVDNKDIEKILKKVPCTIGPKAKQLLEHHINSAIKERCDTLKRGDNAPSKQFRFLSQYHNALARARMLHSQIKEDLAFAFIHRAPAAFSGLPLDQVLELAEAFVAKLFFTLPYLERVAKSAVKKRALEPKPKSRPPKRKVDIGRCIFILRLAGIFKDVFERDTLATRSGPWLSFLAATLSHCEGKELDGAIEAWRTARRWHEKSKRSESVEQDTQLGGLAGYAMANPLKYQESRLIINRPFDPTTRLPGQYARGVTKVLENTRARIASLRDRCFEISRRRRCAIGAYVTGSFWRSTEAMARVVELQLWQRF
jgi:hypothetical protein